MPQGPRGGWLRAVCTGLGAVLCAGAIGCNGLDKDKDTKWGGNTRQPGPGLPGTPTLPGSPGSGVGMGSPKAGQPGGYNTTYPGTGMGTGFQPAGGSSGFSSMPAGRAPGSTTYPAAGSGSGSYNSGANYGNPVVPNVGPANSYPGGSGSGFQPAGGINSGAASSGGNSAGYVVPADTGFSRSAPPAPDLGVPGPVPPAAPGGGPGMGVVPPVGPSAPLAPPYR